MRARSVEEMVVFLFGDEMSARMRVQKFRLDGWMNDPMKIESIGRSKESIIRSSLDSL